MILLTFVSFLIIFLLFKSRKHRSEIVCEGTRAPKTKDPDFCPASCAAGAVTTNSVSPNVRGRPKRTLVSPVKYRDDSDDSDQQQQSPLKKRA